MKNSKNTRRYFREFPGDMKEMFFQKGIAKRHFFPHKSFFLPKTGPDGLKAAIRMIPSVKIEPNNLWQVNLFGLQSVIEEFPTELFFDKDIVWHEQHLNEKGHIATANLVLLENNILYGNNYISDIFQRISRKREYKTRIESNFRGWPYIIFNAILNFAIKKGVKYFYSPTSQFVLKNADPKRTVNGQIFERIYDNPIKQCYRAVKEGNWWKIRMEENHDRIIQVPRSYDLLSSRKRICIIHDIERGLGHVGIDKKLVKRANIHAPHYLEEMIKIEKDAGIHASYNVVGCFLNEIRSTIESGKHAIAFHSYDHRVPKFWSYLKNHLRFEKAIRKIVPSIVSSIRNDQLPKCRNIDYRLKGYRAPQSVLTAELNDRNLCFHNFEWLGNYFPNLYHPLPRLENRIIKIPIQFDDYRMYARNVSYENWEKMALSMLESNDFLAIGLHDCYGDLWLPYYSKFIDKIRIFGELTTLDQVANETYFGHTI